MFEGFSFEQNHRPRPQQAYYDPLTTAGLDSLGDSGSVSPTDSSSRGSSPSFYEYNSYSNLAPTSTPSGHFSSSGKSSRQTSITELSQYFTRQTLTSSNGIRRSSINTSVPLMLRSHDPNSLAILNATHSRRASRRRTSLQQRSVAAHLDRVSSMVEQYLEEGAVPPASVNSSCGRRKSAAAIARDPTLSLGLEAADDDMHPSMMMEEEDDVVGELSSPTSSAFSSVPSPIEGGSSIFGSFSSSHPPAEYFDLSADLVPPTPPLPGDVLGNLSARRGSCDKVMKPVRMRKKAASKSRLSIGIR